MTDAIRSLPGKTVGLPAGPSRVGALIVNADDWGRDRETTDRALECVQRGAVSSVSAMVFMQDSERAAALAIGHGIDAGLHLNFTTAFSGIQVPGALSEQQDRLARYLRHKASRVVFHPGLIAPFEYVVAAQIQEYFRLYHARPERLDGHHHMHLCSNVVFTGLLPPGTIVRRNFSFRPGQKSVWNRLYRRSVDRALSRRHRLTDFFFSLDPLESPDHVRAILSLAKDFIVEVETHPISPREYAFLANRRLLRWDGDAPVAARYALAGASLPAQ